MSLTEAEREILEHATAWRHKSRLYRNHFCAGPDSSDWTTLANLCTQGLMSISRPADVFGGMSVFRVTSKGIQLLEKLGG